MKERLQRKLLQCHEEIEFSGSAVIKSGKLTVAGESFGYANRSDKIKNTKDTRYGIASGCKIFTAVAICQLAERGLLSLDARLQDILDIPLPRFDGEITVHHLLTHTAGIPDYFDEEVLDDYEALWTKHPNYLVRTLEDFLPLFQNEPMKLKVGERFHYNNAGYILLGLIAEEISGQSFTAYVEEHIFKKAGMHDSGYFSLDALPEKTATGYIDLPGGGWKTNIYSLPVKGGSDGGAYVTAEDMTKFWDALLAYNLLNESFTEKLLTPRVQEEGEGSYYGYGVWIEKNRENRVWKYHLMGYDPGVSFHSACYPGKDITVVVCSNESAGAYNMLEAAEEALFAVNIS